MRDYVAISGLFFVIVALAHLLRIIGGWVVTVDEQVMPMNISYFSFVATGFLAIWAFKVK